MLANWLAYTIKFRLLQQRVMQSTKLQSKQCTQFKPEPGQLGGSIKDTRPQESNQGTYQLLLSSLEGVQQILASLLGT